MFCCGRVETHSNEPRQQHDVILNVYDITSWNTVIAWVGLGAHHSGIEVFGEEHSFGRDFPGYTGVGTIEPRCCEQHQFREAIRLGRTRLSKAAVHQLLDEMAEEWQGDVYHVLQRNCNDFSEVLASRLLDGGRGQRHQDFPAWVNRPSRAGVRLLPTWGMEKIEELDKNMFLSHHGACSDADSAPDTGQAGAASRSASGLAPLSSGARTPPQGPRHAAHPPASPPAPPAAQPADSWLGDSAAAVLPSLSSRPSALGAGQGHGEDDTAGEGSRLLSATSGTAGEPCEPFAVSTADDTLRHRAGASQRSADAYA
eukprot:TRINITY_DN9468_c0_g1_i1.p1 TRINITY_DN9468_c0_g1~~TRINITY_DN9468_c0_g1_i1.p1  ORF type:complete len:337 (+),score=97.68 TRINITY_DN9468_c0_g1_i1:73-1011(+)